MSATNLLKGRRHWPARREDDLGKSEDNYSLGGSDCETIVLQYSEMSSEGASL